MLDEHYTDYARICINSIKTNYQNHPPILVFYYGDNESALAPINRIPGVEVIRWTNDLDKLIGLNIAAAKLGVVTYSRIHYKYLLWTNFFDSYDNVLYLDVDTLVLKPLDAIFTQEEFFAISDYTTSPDYRLFYPAFADDATLLGLLHKDNLFFPGGRNDMINAGVFMVPKKRRNEMCLRSLLEITHTYNDYMMFADQSAISLWCHYNNIPIQKKWIYNFQVNFYNQDFNTLKHEDIHIIHFSWCKPDSPLFATFQVKFEHFFEMYRLFNVCRENQY